MRDLELGELVTFDRALRASNAQEPESPVFIVIEKREIKGRSVDPGAYPYYYIFNFNTGKLGPFSRGELDSITLREEEANSIRPST